MKKLLLSLLLISGIGLSNAQTKAPTAKKQKAKVEATTNSKGVKLKKDGTPDRRYKTAKKLKKDGTPDMRYKENKKK